MTPATPETPASDGVLVRTGRLLQGALEALGARPSPEQLESLAVLVHETMASRSRTFHSMGHVFDAARDGGPRVALAAAFHDTVYLQVDGGLAERAEALLSGAYARSGTEVLLPPPGADRPLALVHAIFGLPCGTPVAPTAGLNEMLSAVLAARALGSLLPEREVVRVVAGIEATIPFRGPDAQGRGPAERLRERLQEVVREFGVALGEAELDAAVADSVQLANRDVANFAEAGTAEFLDNTWALLPETNWSLRVRSAYTVREYRTAMQRMEGFLAKLDPGRVFRSFRGQPSPEALAGLAARARHNLLASARYLGVKLVAACVLDALGSLSGGDAPVALLMGDLPSQGEAPLRMEAFLPPFAPPQCDAVGAEVFRLLCHGRAQPSGFDLKNAPMAAYLFSALGSEGVGRAVESSRALCAGGLSPEDFLAGLGAPQAVGAVARACARVAFFRTERLEAIADRMG